MAKIPAQIIVSPKTYQKKLSYCRVTSIHDYVDGSEAIVVSSLDSQYLMLFSSITAIISEKGNELAHLAILAREFGKVVIIAPGVVSSCKQTGTVTVSDTEVTLS